ncbi:MAG TPA: 6-hydroxymethylpterin diphosphokinase MptE-like protein [bacterium]|nr:6-hydroxymethylpterin diphosphokinase MptE-like protein [bacterium]
MNDPQVFERNMLAIASRHGQLCTERLRYAQASTLVGFESSRNNTLVPYLRQGDRSLFMHSRVDPEREALRVAAQYPRTGFYAFLGLGGGYVVTSFLHTERVTRAVIIEYDAGILRAVLEAIDLTHILGDRRVRLLIDPLDEELEEAIVSSYVPSITGDFVSVPLRGRIDADSARYQRATDLIRGTIMSISDDYSVQSFFGKRWFTNIVRNLETSDRPTPPVGPIHAAMVTAAGPSLELAYEEIVAKPRGTFLIATDTSLRALLSRGIEPDAVISIDCQHISYYHFSLGMPEHIPLFLDLASPPTVARLASRPYFFSSGHPLARYIAGRYRAFPEIDTSGGNVTHAAVSLATFLGARTIRLFGADFSYPFGKSYARGTYIYPYFDIRQSRLKPFESLFAEFLLRNQTLVREDDDQGFRYVTKPLVAYRERLERLASNIPARLERVRGYGVVAATEAATAMRASHAGRVFAAGRPFQKPSEFLLGYAEDIARLPEPHEHAASYLDTLGAHEQDVWTTMLPSAAAFRREAGDAPPQPADLLALTRAWCESVVRGELARVP